MAYSVVCSLPRRFQTMYFFMTMPKQRLYVFIVHIFVEIGNIRSDKSLLFKTNMPGSNCSIFGCSTSRKTTGVSIFKVPGGNDEFNTKWRKNLVHIITRERVIDKDLKRQIENRSLHICERHFSEEDICRSRFIY